MKSCNVKYSIILTLILLLIPCYITAETINSSIISSPSLKGRIQTTPEYVLGAGDTLQIFDYITEDNESHPKMIQEVPILPDGTAIIVPIGSVQVEGKTLSELNQYIRNEMGKTIRHPRLFVSISEARPLEIYVIGAVVRPGHYSSDIPGSIMGQSKRSGTKLDRPMMTTTDALEQSGGIKNTANIKNITLYRKKTDETFNIDLWKLMYEGDTSQDISLQSGDVIQVPEVTSNNVLSPREQREISRSTVAPAFINVQVLGAVKSPGIYQLPPESDMITALVSAGGPSKDASNNVFIARINPDGSVKKIKLKLNKTIKKAKTEEERIKLYPQDLLYVKSSPIKRFTDFASETTTTLIKGVTMAILFNMISD